MSTTSASGMGRLRAHRRGQAEAHRAQAAELDSQRPRLVELVELGRPHLMLADADRDDRVLRSRVSCRQLADGVLLQDAVEVLVVLERLVASSTPGTARPSRRYRSGGSTILFSSASAYFTSLQIGMWAGLVLVDLRGVDVDVDDLAVLGELLELAGHAVVEPHAQGDQQVGLVRRRSWHRRVPCMPSMSSDSGSSLGKPPRPITVIVTGMPVLLRRARAARRWPRRR